MKTTAPFLHCDSELLRRYNFIPSSLDRIGKVRADFVPKMVGVTADGHIIRDITNPSNDIMFMFRIKRPHKISCYYAGGHHYFAGPHDSGLTTEEKVKIDRR